MSGVFKSGGGAPAAAPEPMAAPAPAPAAAAPAAPAASLGESRAPITRASTMLSNRRAGDDVRVGTKKLLGQ